MASAAQAGMAAAAGADGRATAGRWLERALLFCFVIHGVAMLAMAAVLLPGMPGGPHGDAARMAYVAAHPWRWRLGWAPWQLTALADLLVALALVRTRWIPRVPAVLTLLVTVAAIVPDQAGQALWLTQGVTLAQTGDAHAYLALETRLFLWIAAGGGLGYTLAAVGWSWCLAAAGTWTRWLTGFSAVLWLLFALLGAAPLLPASPRPPAAWVATGNAVAFVLLLVWLAAVTERVLRRARPDEPYGRLAPWRHPRRALGWALDPLANSRFVRALGEFVPMVALRSDITDVVYVNYVVEAERVAPLVPRGLELQRVGANGHYAVLSSLTYRHGHLGPALLGPMRRLLSSPGQTNWRLYVRDPRTGVEGVYFLTTGMTSTPHALVARLLTEGLPMHVVRPGVVRAGRDGAVCLRLDPGAGSGPDAEATLRPAGQRPETGPWSACFASYDAMLAYVVPQDRALSVQPWHRRVTRQEIYLGIPLEACEPLEGSVRSRVADAIVGDAEPFCFRVARVPFLFAGEYHDRLAWTAGGRTRASTNGKRIPGSRETSA